MGSDIVLKVCLMLVVVLVFGAVSMYVYENRKVDSYCNKVYMSVVRQKRLMARSVRSLVSKIFKR